MSMLLRFAARGLARDRRRSAISGAAIAFGLALFIFSDQLTAGMYDHLLRTGISEQAGHLVLEHQDARGARRPPALPEGISLAERLRERLGAAEIDAVVLARAQLPGILRSPRGVAQSELRAIDPLREPTVSSWRERLVPPPVEEGLAPAESTWLEVGDARGILLGAPLAERLALSVGDKVVFSYQRAGELESYLFRIRGLLRSGQEELDARLALITLSGAQAALTSPGAAHQLTVHLQHLDALPQARLIVDALAAEATEARPSSPLRSLDWREAIPALYQFTEKDRQSARFLFLLIALIIAIGVLNTVTMSVLERRRWFALLLAVGYAPRRVAALILWECVLLGLIAAAAGLVLGLLVSWPAVHYGIDYRDLVGDQVTLEGVSLSLRIHSRWNLSGALGATLAAFLFTIFAGLWPAWRAAQSEPLVASRGELP